MPNAYTSQQGPTIRVLNVDALVSADTEPSQLTATIGDAVREVPTSELWAGRWGGVVNFLLPDGTESVPMKIRVVSQGGISSTITKYLSVAAPSSPADLEREARLERSRAAGIPEGFAGWHDTGPTIGTEFTTVLDGDQTFTEDTSLAATQINGRVIADGCTVTLTDSLVRSGSNLRLHTVNGGSIVGYRVELDGLGGQGGIAVGYNNIELFDSLIHNCVDGARLTNRIKLHHCLIVDLTDNDKKDHNDCVQSTGGGAGDCVVDDFSTLLGNRKSGTFANSAAIVGGETNDQRAILFEDVYMDGGNCTLYVKNAAEGYETIGPIVFRRVLFGGNHRYNDIGLSHEVPNLHFEDCRRVDGQPFSMLLYRADGSAHSDSWTPADLEAAHPA
ncbi:hypothetical protein [Kineococcus esterisolvens]|uniref:hypothetical protein n=1 Tax=unclassified Kineococcus TaxID=2621656 RepID=UPI003D7ED963